MSCLLSPGGWTDPSRLWVFRAAFLSSLRKFTELELSLDEMESQVPFCFGALVMCKQRKQTARYTSVFQNADGVNFYNILTKSAPMSEMKLSLELTQSYLGEWTLKLLDPSPQLCARGNQFFWKALLTYNAYTIKFTHVNCIIQWF